MKKLSSILLVLICLSGCSYYAPAHAPFQPSRGIIFTSVRAPLTTEFDNTKMSRALGEAHSAYVGYSILNFSFGDASIEEALHGDYLKDAAYADYEYTQVLGLFEKVTVRAFGEPTERY